MVWKKTACLRPARPTAVFLQIAVDDSIAIRLSQLSVGFDTLQNRVRYHGMPKRPIRLAVHKTWTPASLERLCGLKPVALRDLRRRGLAPEGEKRTLRLNEVAQLFLQSTLVAHGFGPKRISVIAERYACALMGYALDEPSSWSDEGSYRAWLDGPVSQRKSRYVLLSGSSPEAQLVDTLTELSSIIEPIVTVLDLKSLGQKLSLHLAERPSSASVIGSGTN